MTYSSMNEYLNDLRSNLRDLPKEERDIIIEEIESHFIEKVDELTNKGFNEEAALKKTLTDFKSPSELSKEYIKETLEEDTSHLINVIFLNLSIMGLTVLALPILKGFDWAWIAVGGPTFVVGLIIIYVKKYWSRIEINYINTLPKIVLYMLFPVSLLLFWIANNASGKILTSSLYYMLMYWLLLAIYYFFIKKIKKAI